MWWSSKVQDGSVESKKKAFACIRKPSSWELLGSYSNPSRWSHYMEIRGAGEPSKFHPCGHVQLLQQRCHTSADVRWWRAQRAPHCLYSQRLELLLGGDLLSGAPVAALRAGHHSTSPFVRPELLLVFAHAWSLTGALSQQHWGSLAVLSLASKS